MEKRTTLTDNVQNSRENISELKEEIVGFDEKLKVYDDFLTTIDIEDLLSQKKEYDEFKQLYDETVNRARLMDNNYKAMSKKLTLLDEVPCGNQYVAKCQFISDAHGASQELPLLEKRIVSKIEEARTYKEKVVAVDSAEMAELIDRYNETIIAKNAIEIEKRDNKVSIERQFGKIKTMTSDLDMVNQKIDLYEDNKEAIQNIEKLISSRAAVQKQTQTTTATINDLENTKNEHNRLIGSLEQKVETLHDKKEELFLIL